MFKTKKFWQRAMIIVVVSWIFLILFGFVFTTGISMLAKVITALLFVIHASQLYITFKIGNDKDISPAMVVIKTLLFGLTWWVPVKIGVFEK